MERGRKGKEEGEGERGRRERRGRWREEGEEEGRKEEQKLCLGVGNSGIPPFASNTAPLSLCSPSPSPHSLLPPPALAKKSCIKERDAL